MGEVARTDGAPALTIAEGDPARIRRQIEATRAELGDTVAALALKADVRRQAHDRIEALRQKANARRQRGLAAGSGRAPPRPLLAVGAVAAGFLLGRLTAR